jgi:hypothetical protein
MAAGYEVNFLAAIRLGLPEEDVVGKGTRKGRTLYKEVEKLKVAAAGALPNLENALTEASALVRALTEPGDTADENTWSVYEDDREAKESDRDRARAKRDQSQAQEDAARAWLSEHRFLISVAANKSWSQLGGWTELEQWAEQKAAAGGGGGGAAGGGGGGGGTGGSVGREPKRARLTYANFDFSVSAAAGGGAPSGQSQVMALEVMAQILQQAVVGEDKLVLTKYVKEDDFASRLVEGAGLLDSKGDDCAEIVELIASEVKQTEWAKSCVGYLHFMALNLSAEAEEDTDGAGSLAASLSLENRINASLQSATQKPKSGLQQYNTVVLSLTRAMDRGARAAKVLGHKVAAVLRTLDFAGVHPSEVCLFMERERTYVMCAALMVEVKSLLLEVVSMHRRMCRSVADRNGLCALDDFRWPVGTGAVANTEPARLAHALVLDAFRSQHAQAIERQALSVETSIAKQYQVQITEHQRQEFDLMASQPGAMAGSHDVLLGRGSARRANAVAAAAPALSPQQQQAPWPPVARAAPHSGGGGAVRQPVWGNGVQQVQQQQQQQQQRLLPPPPPPPAGGGRLGQRLSKPVGPGEKPTVVVDGAVLSVVNQIQGAGQRNGPPMRCFSLRVNSGQMKRLPERLWAEASCQGEVWRDRCWRGIDLDTGLGLMSTSGQSVCWRCGLTGHRSADEQACWQQSGHMSLAQSAANFNWHAQH